MKEISGTIKNIVYQNRENGYTVMRTTGGHTLCGVLYDAGINLEGAEFSASGQWQKHKKFGLQFSFESFAVNESELFYFLSRIVKGIGKKLARTLIDQYGEDNLEILMEMNPGELLKVKGIKQRKLQKILDNWNRYKELKGIAEALVPYGATQSIVSRVYRHYKDDQAIVDKIRSNPYIITEVKGIGFKTADRIARNRGIAPHSDCRIAASIDYVLLKYTADEGNSCIEVEKLYELVNEEVAFTDAEGRENSVPRQLFDAVLQVLGTEGRVSFPVPQKVTSGFLHYAESRILSTVMDKGARKIGPLSDDIENFIAEKEQHMGISFSEEQRKAITTANEGYRLFLLCGYAGTGKSTISRAVLDLLATRFHREQIMCCALSGIAADRIRKTSTFHASTIQSLLVRADKEDDGILPYRVLLLDEASMVNSEIMYKLFRALHDDALCIMVGDPAQLPPIGAGNPFYDILGHRVAPVVELTRIYRQSEDKVITWFANQIREARVPAGYQQKYEDFQYIDVSIQNYFAVRNKLRPPELKQMREQNAEDIRSRLLDIAKQYRSRLQEYLRARDIRSYVTSFQVITPLKGGPLGADALNVALQETLNPHADTVDLGHVRFALYDKVVHIANQDMDCYTPQTFRAKDRDEGQMRRRVFNGMIGVFFKMDAGEELIWVFYPNDNLVVEYSFDEARDLLRLAYALTIHKTQGSEYRTVVIPMTFSHFVMLNNKLLYTAVTRARDKCIIIGEQYAFRSACVRKDATVRDTVMQYL